MTETVERLLAEMHIARRLSDRPAREAATGVTTADLWAEARREAGAPASLAVARALRDRQDVARRYRRMLEGLALAHAPVALAASDGDVRRRIGDAELRLLTQDGGALLVIENAGAARALDIMAEDGETLRLALPQEDGGAMILSLGADTPDGARAHALLRDPGTALFLLP